MTHLTIQHRQHGPVAVLDVEGELLVGEDATSLRETMRSLLAAGETQIIINLGGVRYLNSCGLGDLVSAFATAKTHGAVVKLVNLEPRIDNLLQTTKLLTVFEVFEGEEQAVRSFGEGSAAPGGCP